VKPSEAIFRSGAAGTVADPSPSSATGDGHGNPAVPDPRLAQHDDHAQLGRDDDL
jgi:hypothetical protein